ncbi:uncharacterized protein UV8b_03901 [Ustilaginoidea virens]|uniref:Uncharacterized protein n=1 Tax=Ustilaginoidea virens TaxID=1159556 RepID=A0A063BW29_USTVR|nr:uncharacterized protein UV8b_03901 [Ustilaginoidea virens]QUC19660.1 hypothetical protein UV8b_03901 [Ustilaginoidea virens]GAO13866.1 hypothetical protein UVI_02004160 [Ustilaginoidea virens]
MAIRDRFRRALRRSEENSDAISQTESNTTTTTNTSDTSSVHKSTASSKLARTFAWQRRSKDEPDKEAKRNRKNSRLHPSQRPLTLQNLKHQEMLSHFTMTFGASDPSQIETLSFVGVSPCCTRAPSLDMQRQDTRGSSPASDLPKPDSDRD